MVAAARQQHAAALRSYVADLLQADRERIDSVLEGTWRALARETENDATDKGAVWLFAEAHRRAVAVQRAAPAAEDDPAAGEDESAEGRFALLTAKQREVLRLKFVHGFANDEIARIVDLGSLQAARMLHNALARLAPAFRAANSAPALAVEDPRLTLAALGDLDPAAWRAWESGQVNPAATNARMEEVRQAAAWVKEHFASGGHRRTEAQRRRRRWWPAVAVLVAVLAVGAVLWFRNRTDPGRETAADEEVKVTARGVAVRQAERGSSRDRRSEGTDVRSLGLFRETDRRVTTPSKTPAARSSVPPADSQDRDAPSSPEQGPATNAANESTEDGEVAVSAGITTPPSRQPLAQRRGEAGPTSSSGPRAASRGGEVAHIPERRSPEKNPEETAESADAANSTPAAPTHDARPGRSRPTPGGANGAAAPAPAARADGSGKLVAPVSTDIAPILALKRALAQGRWPKPEEVSRTRLLRHFARPPKQTSSAGPFAGASEATEVPWLPSKVAVRLAATARMDAAGVRAPANLILLLDASGSMDAPNRWALVVEAVGGLLDRLRPDDRIGVVTYAGESQVLFAPEPLRNPRAVREAVQAIEPRGRTNGGAGLEEAFALAGRAGGEQGAHLVILCTDGDFNMGATTQAELLELVERHAASGVRLAVFGFGRNGRIDPRLEQLAALAQGGSGYVNTRAEAVSVLFRQLGGLIEAVAADVTLQVEVGGEERAAGEWKTVLPGETAAEIVVAERGQTVRAKLAYRAESPPAPGAEVLAWDGKVAAVAETSEEFRFELAVGRLADLLAGPRDAAEGKWDELESWVRAQVGEAGGYRAELLDLIAQARVASSDRIE